MRDGGALSIATFRERRRSGAVRLLAVLVGLAAAPALACGPETDCPVGEGRSYRLYLPEAEGPMGAVLFAHGYRGSAAGTMRNRALKRLADSLGIAFVALDADGPDWDLAHAPRAPDRKEALEYGYVDAVLDDLAERMALDASRVVLSGFSAGGMFTWTIACGASQRFAGFVPLSGTFWAPGPESCPAPAGNLVHIHGTEDRTVPLAGRPIGPARQGDVADALDLYRAHGGYRPRGRREAPGEMRCEEARSDGGKVLAFCSFEGGHSFSVDRLRYGIERVLGGD